MATSTSFGWELPDDTDLVKDGAAAMRTLGNAIDASMTDLRGGTTGQILSKASNTDMDFTWVASNPGDITEVTAGTGLTGGGTSGAVSLAFDVANYGGGQWAAGKNKVINGNFGIWQRGTSFSLNNSSTYTADRWLGWSDTTATVSQQTFTPGTAPVAGYEGTFFLRLAKNANGTFITAKQRIEDVRTFAGQTVTISFWAKASSATTIEPYYTQNFGTGGSAEVAAAITTFSLTTSWARYSFSFALPSVSGKTIGANNHLAIDPLRWVGGSGAITIDGWGVQLEAGSVATPFQTATGTIQGELAACQRYYYRTVADSAYSIFGTGNASSTTQGNILVPFPVQMRTSPSSLEYSTIAAFDGVSVTAITSATLQYSNRNSGVLQYTVASGLTQYRAMSLLSNNSTSGYLGFPAEL